MPLSTLSFDHLVRQALEEDIGTGDITTSATVPPDVTATAQLLAKSPLVLCGLDVARQVFFQTNSTLLFETILEDGAFIDGDKELIGTIRGPASSILTAERVALNFLQRLSGVATLTSAYVKAVAGTDARIIDTRKTTPGLRVLEKYAVRVGGGVNHRFGLADGVLIKDNHIAAAGGIGKAISNARKIAPHTLKIEVEVKSLDQIPEALDSGVDIILLDNLGPADLRTAVELIGNKAITEASGGVNLTTVRAIAESGVNLISVGALTHSAPAVDISLDIPSQQAV